MITLFFIILFIVLLVLASRVETLTAERDTLIEKRSDLITEKADLIEDLDVDDDYDPELEALRDEITKLRDYS